MAPRTEDRRDGDGGEDREATPEPEGCVRTQADPHRAGDDRCEQQADALERAVDAEHRAAQVRGRGLGDEGALGAAEEGRAGAVGGEEDDHGGLGRGARESEVDQSGAQIPGAQDGTAAEPVGEPARWDGEQRGRDVEDQVEEHHLAQREAHVGGLEEQERVRGVAQAEEEDGAQVEPQASVQVRPAQSRPRTGRSLDPLLAHGRDDQDADDRRDDGPEECLVERGPGADHHEREQSAGRRPCHVEHLGQPEGATQLLLVAGLRDQGVSRSGADSLAGAVNDSRQQDATPGRRHEQQELVDDGPGVPEEGQALAVLANVAEVAAEDLEQCRDALGDPLDHADDHGCGTQGRGQEDRHDRVDHLGAQVDEHAGEPDQHHVRDGASAGALLAFVVVSTGTAFHQAFLWSIVPAVIGILIIPAVREQRIERPAGARPTLRGAHLDGHLRLYLGTVFFFCLGNSSNAFLLLKAADMGFSLSQVMLLYLVFNVSASVVAVPSGRFSDRFGRRSVLVPGYLLSCLVYLGLAGLTSKPAVVVLFVAYGACTAFLSGAERAFVAEAAPPHLRGTVLGIYGTLQGIGLLLASIVAGAMWVGLGPDAPFWFGGSLAILSAVAVTAILGSGRHGRPQAELSPPGS